MGMLERQPDEPGGDTLPEFPAVVDPPDSDFHRIARRVRRRRAVRQTSEGLLEFAKAAPEMVLEFIQGAVAVDV